MNLREYEGSGTKTRREHQIMKTPYDSQIALVHWDGRAVGETTIREIIATLQEYTPNVKAIWVKTNDGDSWQGTCDTSGKADLRITGPRDLERWITTCGEAGIAVHAWCVARGLNVDQEIAVVVDACRVDGLASFILDVEVGQLYFRGGPQTAQKMGEEIRRRVPSGLHVALNLDYRGYHPRDIHIDKWLPYVDSLHPMVYHKTFGVSPEQAVTKAFENLAQYNRPIIPMLQAHGLDDVDEMVTAANLATARFGARGISFWRFGNIGAREFASIKTIAPPEVETEREAITLRDFTNQDLINAIADAAARRGEDYWAWIVSSGLGYLVDNRRARYNGTPINDLPGLSADEKLLILRALGVGEPDTGEKEVIRERFTNQQVINAFYEAARLTGQPDNAWNLILEAGLENMVDDRYGPYMGPEPDNLPSLSDELKAIIYETLIAWAPEAGDVLLKVPWISQIQPHAGDGNDCGQTCVLMALKYHDPSKKHLNVEDLTNHPNLIKYKNKYTDAADLIDVAFTYGLTLKPDYHFGQVSNLIKQLRAERPVILLVNYPLLHFDTVHSAGGHWITLVGYQDGEIVLNDPLWLKAERGGKGGKHLKVSKQTLQNALIGNNALY
jgi:uncharacterized protein YvpB